MTSRGWVRHRVDTVARSQYGCSSQCIDRVQAASKIETTGASSLVAIVGGSVAEKGSGSAYEPSIATMHPKMAAAIDQPWYSEGSL